MFYVYLLQSESHHDQRYTGYTTDLQQRFKKHNEGASIHTAKYSIDGASFMFTVAPGGETWEMQDGVPLRRVREIDELMDVGPVTFPAYPQASASARNKVIELRQQQNEPTEPEGEGGGSPETDQKAERDDQTLALMAMEIEIEQDDKE